MKDVVRKVIGRYEHCCDASDDACNDGEVLHLEFEGLELMI